MRREKQMQPLQALVETLLDTDEGLSETQYQALLDVLKENEAINLIENIQSRIDGFNGRIFFAEPKAQTYNIYYRMQCQVKATSKEDAMNKYYNDETTNHKFHEFLSIEEAD